ncbi:hypothetical protein [Desulfosporosinus sp. BG]|uniref:hypothetical protein n=1 Tax=Desulfosporosinus sp. BG TaxID=1633135 RepID=UPI00083AE74F|nr:hypothetical protein [Desulfosporosinus sp. BG]ODA39173.1 hypothetical protein DSBG_4026 [Desulfosporosinus sp. BG]
MDGKLMNFSNSTTDKTERLKDYKALADQTVQLKLHHMDVKQLRKLFTQNNKIIRDTLERYKGRYTTKANITIYKLMVIALDAELQNVL